MLRIKTFLLRNPPMTKDYRSRLERYLATMLQAKRMFTQGIISPEDYVKIDAIIAGKYGLGSRNLYRGINLIYQETVGNMSHHREATT